MIDRYGKLKEIEFTMGQVSKFNDKAELKGIFDLKVVEKGEVIDHIRDENLIVNGAREVMAIQIAESTSDGEVSIIALGDGGWTGDIYTPVAPDAADTELENELFRKGLNSFSYPTVTSVAFYFVVETTEANGSGTVHYTEAGLFTTGNTMFARKTFAAMTKTSDREFRFTWTILF